MHFRIIGQLYVIFYPRRNDRRGLEFYRVYVWIYVCQPAKGLTCVMFLNMEFNWLKFWKFTFWILLMCVHGRQIHGIIYFIPELHIADR